MLESVTGVNPGPMARLAGRLIALTGWRRQLTAFAAGTIAAAALPPLNLVFMLWPSFVLLLWLLQGLAGRGRGRLAALTGWSFGFGYFLFGLYWVGSSFLVEAEKYALFMPFAVAGLAGYMAVFPGLACWLTHFSGRRGLARILVFAAAWLATEWLRGLAFTGFPWNLLGTVWSFSDEMIQIAAFGGVWALSALTLLAAAAPAALNDGARRVGVLLLITLIPLVWGAGALRLDLAPPPGSNDVPDQKLRLVQPAINQALKWRPELRLGHIEKQVKLSLSPGFEEITQVIWAETAVPFLLNREAELVAHLGRVAPPGGHLLTGAPRLIGEEADTRLFNSFLALDGISGISAAFDKYHLVPFGEYDPFSDWLPFFRLTTGGKDFSPGTGPKTWTLANLPPVTPLICYEVIFPGAIISAEGPRPAWILNATNDAWFGHTSGPYQHFAAARLRAVEEGLPLVRVANNGISALIDGYGRIRAQLDLDVEGILDVPLPKPITGITWYARLGNFSLSIILAMMVIPLFVSWLSGRAGSNRDL